MKTAPAMTIAATMLTTTPFVTPASQGDKMAQVDMQGRHFDERDPSAFYREHPRGYDANSGVVPSGATVSSQHRARGALPKRRATKR
jgi:hypothetical protein